MLHCFGSPSSAVNGHHATRNIESACFTVYCWDCEILGTWVTRTSTSCTQTHTHPMPYSSLDTAHAVTYIWQGVTTMVSPSVGILWWLEWRDCDLSVGQLPVSHVEALCSYASSSTITVCIVAPNLPLQHPTGLLLYDAQTLHCFVTFPFDSVSLFPLLTGMTREYILSRTSSHLSSVL